MQSHRHPNGLAWTHFNLFVLGLQGQDASLCPPGDALNIEAAYALISAAIFHDMSHCHEWSRR